MNTSEDRRRIVMLGTDFHTMGGISSVVNVYREAGLFERFQDPVFALAHGRAVHRHVSASLVDDPHAACRDMLNALPGERFDHLSRGQRTFLVSQITQARRAEGFGQAVEVCEVEAKGIEFGYQCAGRRGAVQVEALDSCECGDGMLVGDVECDHIGSASRLLDLSLQRLKSGEPSRTQHDAITVSGQDTREMRSQS